MNYAAIKGHITGDPEIRTAQTANGVMTIANYTVAINRAGQNAGTDFIPCKALGKNGEFAEKYLRKGMSILVEGSVRVDNYKDKDGNSKSFTYVQVSRHEFCEKREGAAKPAAADGFMNVPDGFDEELPFN